MKLEEINIVSEQSDTQKEQPNSEQSDTQKHAPDWVEYVPPEKENNKSSSSTTDNSSKWETPTLTSTEMPQADPVWIDEDTVTRRNWRVALTSTVALMALLVTTALGAPRLLSNNEQAPTASTSPTQVAKGMSAGITNTATVAVSAAAASPTYKIPINGVLSNTEPTGTPRIPPVPARSSTTTPTRSVSTPRSTVAVRTATSIATATSRPALTATAVATATATNAATSTAVATATALATATAVVTATVPATATPIATATATAIPPTALPTRPAPTRARPTVRPFPTQTLPRPAPTQPRATATPQPATNTPIPTPTRYRVEPPPTPPQARTYVVQPGDTLLTVAASLGVSANALAEANGLQFGAPIYPGQILRIP